MGPREEAFVIKQINIVIGARKGSATRLQTISSPRFQIGIGSVAAGVVLPEGNGLWHGVITAKRYKNLGRTVTKGLNGR